MTDRTDDLNILQIRPLISPAVLAEELPATSDDEAFVSESRNTARRILANEDPRLLVVVGPCSIHDPKAALEYAEKLKGVAERLGDRLFVVMRVYFEKPRTVMGWKGLINDPDLDSPSTMLTTTMRNMTPTITPSRLKKLFSFSVQIC